MSLNCVNLIRPISGEAVMDIPFTEHARIRMQQRAISREMLETLFAYGKTRFNGNGTEIVTFPKNAVKRLKTSLPKSMYKTIERHLDLYAVISRTGDLVTAGYRTRKLKLH